MMFLLKKTTFFDWHFLPCPSLYIFHLILKNILSTDILFYLIFIFSLTYFLFYFLLFVGFFVLWTKCLKILFADFLVRWIFYPWYIFSRIFCPRIATGASVPHILLFIKVHYFNWQIECNKVNPTFSIIVIKHIFILKKFRINKRLTMFSLTGNNSLLYVHILSDINTH